jgi:hypothetical protein
MRWDEEPKIEIIKLPNSQWCNDELHMRINLDDTIETLQDKLIELVIQYHQEADYYYTPNPNDRLDEITNDLYALGGDLFPYTTKINESIIDETGLLVAVIPENHTFNLDALSQESYIANSYEFAQDDVEDSDDDSSESEPEDAPVIQPHSFYHILNNPMTNPMTNPMNIMNLIHPIQSLNNQPITPINSLMNISNLIQTFLQHPGIAPQQMTIPTSFFENVVVRLHPDDVAAMSDISYSACQQKTEQTSCCICMDTFTENDIVKELPCHHIYHSNCIKDWFKEHNTCPICKYKITNENFR